MYSVHWQFFVYQHKYQFCVYVVNGIEKNSFFVMLVSKITVHISSYSLLCSNARTVFSLQISCFTMNLKTLLLLDFC